MKSLKLTCIFLSLLLSAAISFGQLPTVIKEDGCNITKEQAREIAIANGLDPPYYYFKLEFPGKWAVAKHFEEPYGDCEEGYNVEIWIDCQSGEILDRSEWSACEGGPPGSFGFAWSNLLLILGALAAIGIVVTRLLKT